MDSHCFKVDLIQLMFQKADCIQWRLKNQCWGGQSSNLIQFLLNFFLVIYQLIKFQFSKHAIPILQYKYPNTCRAIVILHCQYSNISRTLSWYFVLLLRYCSGQYFNRASRCNNGTIWFSWKLQSSLAISTLSNQCSSYYHWRIKITLWFQIYFI